MITRYSRPQMTNIWSDQHRFEIWLKVETLALEQMAKEGLAPGEAVRDLKAKGKFDANRVLEIEAEVKHDVIAFLTNVAEYVGDNSRFVHRGMTSNDLLDTSFAVQLKEAGTMLLTGLDTLLESIKKRAEEYKHTPCIGRSHGIHAEPITFGLKVISWFAELKRQRRRLASAIEEVSYGKISGAVGTFASLPPTIEAYVMKQLGLKPEPVATQVVSRDRHACFFSALAQLASSIERICVEIRHLQRTEVREAEEPFGKGQKGSSAMPHKRNPILTENLTGLARLVRSNSIAALENVALWHERDISHSSVERVIAPDSTILMDFMLARLNSIITGLVVHPQRMIENLQASRGLTFSGTLLVTLVDNGVIREDAYRMIQNHALPAWEGGPDFEARVRADSEITKRLKPEVLDAVFDLKRHAAHVDIIFKRALED